MCSGCYRSFIQDRQPPLSFSWIHSAFLAGFSSAPSIQYPGKRSPLAIEAPLHHQLCQLRCNSVVTTLTSASSRYLLPNRRKCDPLQLFRADHLSQAHHPLVGASLCRGQTPNCLHCAITHKSLLLAGCFALQRQAAMDEQIAQPENGGPVPDV